MTFEQQFGLYVVGILVIAAAVIYFVHLATREGYAGRADQLHRDARPDRAAVSNGGGAGRPPAGTTTGPRHAVPR
ncbi:hypothetical protein ACWEFJ_28525 [Actinosynnema sp. NPDC004786]